MTDQKVEEVRQQYLELERRRNNAQRALVEAQAKRSMILSEIQNLHQEMSQWGCSTPAELEALIEQRAAQILAAMQ